MPERSEEDVQAIERKIAARSAAQGLVDASISSTALARPPRGGDAT